MPTYSTVNLAQEKNAKSLTKSRIEQKNLSVHIVSSDYPRVKQYISDTYTFRYM